MDYWALIGSGNGVMLFFTTKQLDGTYYTTAVLDQLNSMAGLPNTASELANKNNIYANTDDAKADLYEKIRQVVLPTETSYDFRRRVFINEDLSEAEALQYIKTGEILVLIGLASTKELLEVSDSNGFLPKVVG